MIGVGRWLWAGVGAALGLLVHEAFLLLNLPLVLAFAATAKPPPEKWGNWIRLGGPPAVVFLALQLAGRYEPGLAALEQLFSGSPRYMEAVGGKVPIDQLAVLTRSWADNWEFVRREFWITRAYFHLPLSAGWGVIMAHFFS